MLTTCGRSLGQDVQFDLRRLPHQHCESGQMMPKMEAWVAFPVLLPVSLCALELLELHPISYLP
jgi:hypothetical protein